MTDREIRKPTGKDLGFATSSSSPEISINGDVNLIVNGSPVRVELGGGRLIPSVGFLGPRGTYTEEAKEALMGVNTSGKFTEEPLRMTNRGVVEVIDQGVFDVGVVASENAIEGDVAMTWKALLKSDLSILGETVLPIHNMLIGNPDEPITEIRTHSHAFPQCERFLTQYHPDVERVETSSTAQAVEDIVNRKGAAAIASRKVAELYRVPIIAENIGDNSHNATRFFLLGRGETEPTGNDTTTLAFVPEINGPGTLLDYLRPFAERGIDMTKIDSHPSGKMGKYLFLISIDGHSKDAKISKAVSELGVICEQIKILGSYKKADIPEGVNVPGTWNGD